MFVCLYVFKKKLLCLFFVTPYSQSKELVLEVVSFWLSILFKKDGYRIFHIHEVPSMPSRLPPGHVLNSIQDYIV